MRYSRFALTCTFVVAVGLTTAVCAETPSAAGQSPGTQTTAPPPAGGDPVVAEVVGRAIRLSEVDARWQEFDAAEKARVTQALYQNRRNMIEQMVGDALIEQAAKAANMSAADYLQREAPKRVQPATDADIQKFYDENKDRAQGRTLDDLKGPIKEFLDSQRQQQARAMIVDELRIKGAAVKVLLEPPRMTVEVAANDPVRGESTASLTLVEFSDYQ
jgi:hypothetical protein